jgi:hypothetical protein
MLKRFEPGNPGGGRPRGAKNRLHRAFVEALHADFEEHGPEAIRICRMEDPTNYLRVIASILPGELSIETAAVDLTYDELEALIQRTEMLAALTPEPLLRACTHKIAIGGSGLTTSALDRFADSSRTS